MISLLTGKLLHTDPRSVVLDVNGVGYKVYISKLPQEKNGLMTFWTYLAVRENALDLYGFLDKEELAIFELLLSVSGIGPKTAATILSVATPDIIRRAVVRENADYFLQDFGYRSKKRRKDCFGIKRKNDW